MDDEEIKLTDEVKKQVLKELLPIASKGDVFDVNGDIKDRAQLSN